MLILEIRFLTGRFHATPWDAHVNEGRVEWPPSPYRLLRALVAVAWGKLPGIEASTLETLLAKLASELPVYRLPPATTSHFRHYAPSGTERKDGDYKREKLFDAFVHVASEEPLLVTWPKVELEAPETELLASILAQLTYLGRAESWIEARLGHAWDGEIDAWPHDGDADAAGDPLRFLVPMLGDELRAFRDEALQRERSAAEAAALAKGKVGKDGSAKLSKKQLEELGADLPTTLLDVLGSENPVLRKAGWARPPGTRWQAYRRRAGALELDVRRAAASGEIGGPRVVRFAIDSAVHPRFVDAVSITDRLHKTLCKSDVPTLIGMENGAPLVGHEHAYLFCEPDARGRVGGMTVFVPSGLDVQARRALEEVEWLWGHDGHHLHLLHLLETDPEDRALGSTRDGGSVYFGRSRIWQSITPFVSTRHPKQTRTGVPKLDESGRQIGSPEHDLVRLLTQRGFPVPRQVQRVDEVVLAGRATPWFAFRTERHEGSGRRGPCSPSGYRLVFEEPVSGPIVVGYGAHFGLGAFQPLAESAASACDASASSASP